MASLNNTPQVMMKMTTGVLAVNEIDFLPIFCVYLNFKWPVSLFCISCARLATHGVNLVLWGPVGYKRRGMLAGTGGHQPDRGHLQGQGEAQPRQCAGPRGSPGTGACRPPAAAAAGDSPRNYLTRKSLQSSACWVAQGEESVLVMVRNGCCEGVVILGRVLLGKRYLLRKDL